jgi:hypothetical protein
MMKNSVISLIVVVFVGVLLNACASTKLSQTWVDESFKGKTVSNVLVIGIADDDSKRRLFESTFVQQLKAVGIAAVSSADVIPIPANKKLEKETILQVINKFNNDAVLITHVAGIDSSLSYQRAVVGTGVGYYGHYRYTYGRVIVPSRVTSHKKICLKTNLYDAESEKLIWSGQSQSRKPDYIRQLIDEVIELVVKDMQKNKLLPKR